MSNVAEVFSVYNKTASDNQTNMILVMALITEDAPKEKVLLDLGYLPSVAGVAFSIAYIGEEKTLELLKEMFPKLDNKKQLKLAKKLINLMEKCDEVYP